jgi:DNA-binding response OmpR family regulator
MHTVLIVEDWCALRQKLDESLREAGYHTLLAETGEEALGLMRTFRVDLLVARERLADVEGSALAEILRRRGCEELVVVLQAEDPATAARLRGRGVADAVVSRTLQVSRVVRLVRRLLRPIVLTSPPSAGYGDTFAPVVA